MNDRDRAMIQAETDVLDAKTSVPALRCTRSKTACTWSMADAIRVPQSGPA